jgi:hypothetical protein
MTDQTASAADSAQEQIDLIDPVTGQTSQTTTDDMPDHGVLVMDLGELLADPEPYESTYVVRTSLRQGGQVLVKDGADRKVILCLTTDVGTISVEMTGGEGDRVRSALMHADNAASHGG